MQTIPSNPVYSNQILFSPKWFLCLGSIVFVFILSFFLPLPIWVAQIITLCFFIFTLADLFFLWVGKNPTAHRNCPERLSNGDWNLVKISLVNHYPFTVNIHLIDELPFQFQIRNFETTKTIKARGKFLIEYKLKPLERGEYAFGKIVLLIRTGLGFIIKKVGIEENKTVAVYPSYVQMRRYELFAQSTHSNGYGNKKIRKLGHSLEFEQIKEYVIGDDVRSINWKATARRSNLMVNNFTDEKSQQVYCMIDKGRLMKMPFDNLTLLDYAINATLVLSNICLQKQDRIGLITFSNKNESLLAADKKPMQLDHILQLLYKQKTQFLESDYEKLYLQVRSHIKQRSLLVLFTNFESVSGLRRHLPYLKKINSHHLLLVVFFENTELKNVSQKWVNDVEGLYTKTIAEKMLFEKKMIVKQLANHGISSILSAPAKLTINTINKYLEIKAKQAI